MHLFKFKWGENVYWLKQRILALFWIHKFALRHFFKHRNITVAWIASKSTQRRHYSLKIIISAGHLLKLEHRMIDTMVNSQPILTTLVTAPIIAESKGILVENDPVVLRTITYHTTTTNSVNIINNQGLI